MKNQIGLTFALALFFSSLLGCHIEKKSGNGFKPNDDYVDLGSISPNFNPDRQDFEFDVAGVEKVKINLFGFNEDVRLQYSNQMDVNTAHLQVFTVSRTGGSLNGVDASQDKGAQLLEIRKFGNFACSIRVHNRQITELEGACYTRVILTLPAGAKIEVYNVGKLISRPFFPMDNQTFIHELDRAIGDDAGLVVLNSYLKSHQVTATKPVLICQELQQVLKTFSWADNKFTVLRALHPYVQDRENHEKMIEDSFSFFDRAKAREIVGLKP